MKRRLLLNCVLLLASLAAGGAAMAHGEAYGRWNSQVEYFQWREYRPSGSPLLEEQGIRIGAGFDEHNFTRRRLPGLLYHLKVMGYAGRVGYTGETSVGTDASTSVNYLGGTIDATLGQRYGYLRGAYAVDGLVGGSVDGWLRHLMDGVDSAGNAVQGYYEIYAVASAKAAGGLAFKSGRYAGYIQAGIKMPVLARERVSLTGSMLAPAPLPSLYGRFELTNVVPHIRHGVSLAITYDSYRFGKSAVVGGVYQPKSTMNVIGVQLAF